MAKRPCTANSRDTLPADIIVPEEERTIPDEPATPETGALLQVILVDAGRNIIRAIRGWKLSPGFTRQLHQAIRRQAALPWDATLYDTLMKQACAKFLSALRILPQAVARCRGKVTEQGTLP